MRLVLGLIVLDAAAHGVDLTGGRVARFTNKPGSLRAQVKFSGELSIVAPLPSPLCPGVSAFRLRTDRHDSGPVHLDCVNWGRAGLAGYRYQDRGSSARGLRKVRIKTGGGGGQLILGWDGPAYGEIAIDGPVDWVEVRLTIDGVEFCGRFDAAQSISGRNRYDIVDLRGASAACESLPTPTPSATATDTATPTDTPDWVPVPTVEGTEWIATQTPTPTFAGPEPTSTWTKAPTISASDPDCPFRNKLSDTWRRVSTRHANRCVTECPNSQCPGVDYLSAVGRCNCYFGSDCGPGGVCGLDRLCVSGSNAACGENSQCLGNICVSHHCSVGFGPNKAGGKIPDDFLPGDANPIETLLSAMPYAQTSFEEREEHCEQDKVKKGCSSPLANWRWAWGHICEEELRAGRTHCNECDTTRWSDIPSTPSSADAWGVWSCYERDYVAPQINDVLATLTAFESPRPGHRDGVHLSSACAGAFMNAFGWAISRDYLEGQMPPCGACEPLDAHVGISFCETAWFDSVFANACIGHPGVTPKAIPAVDDSEFPFALARQICQREMTRLKPVADGWRIAHGEPPYPSFTPTPASAP